MLEILARLLGADAMDVVDLERATALLRDRADRDGRVVLERRPGAFPRVPARGDPLLVGRSGSELVAPGAGHSQYASRDGVLDLLAGSLEVALGLLARALSLELVVGGSPRRPRLRGSRAEGAAEPAAHANDRTRPSVHCSRYCPARRGLGRFMSHDASRRPGRKWSLVCAPRVGATRDAGRDGAGAAGAVSCPPTWPRSPPSPGAADRVRADHLRPADRGHDDRRAAAPGDRAGVGGRHRLWLRRGGALPLRTRGRHHRVPPGPGRRRGPRCWPSWATTTSTSATATAAKAPLTGPRSTASRSPRWRTGRCRPRCSISSPRRGAGLPGRGRRRRRAGPPARRAHRDPVAGEVRAPDRATLSPPAPCSVTPGGVPVRLRRSEWGPVQVGKTKE